MDNWGKAAVAGVLASLTAAATAQAQTQQIPPVHYTVDGNGVDLVTRELHTVTSEVVIGQPGAGGLSYGRVALQVGWRDLSIGGIDCNGSPSICTVSIGGMSEQFQDAGGGSYTSLSREGSTLSSGGGSFAYRSADGTAAVFTAVSGSNPYSANTALLSSVTAPNGEVTSYTYGTVGSTQRLEAITNNYGYQLLYTYDAVTPTAVEKVLGYNMAVCTPAVPNCNSITWPSITYARYSDGAGGVNEYATDQGGRQTLYHLDISGQLDRIRLPGQTGYQTNVLRDSLDWVYYAEGPAGIWTYTTSDSGGVRTVTATGPSGQVTTVVTDLTVGQPFEVRQLLDPSVPKNITHYYGYDSYGRLTEITNPEGDKTNYGYDTHGNVTSTIMTAKGGGSTFTSSATFPCATVVTCDNPSTTTDRFNRVTNYTWDTTHGGLLKVELPAPSSSAPRPETRYAYAALNAYFYNTSGSIVAGSAITLPTQVSACPTGAGAACVGTASESRSSINYATGGGLTNLLPYSTTNQAGDGSIVATTTMGYTHNGDVASITGPLGGSTTVEYLYDVNRQVIGVIDPDPDGSGGLLNRAQRMTYSPRGQVTLTEAGTTTGYGSAWSSFNTLQRQAATYDDFGRALTARQQDAGGTDYAVQQISYDASGRAECSATRMYPATYGSLPGSACVRATRGPYGEDRIVKTVYDRLNRPISTTSGVGSSLIPNDDITESITYTDNGQPATLTDGKGNVSVMLYDGFDRPTRLCYAVVSPSCAATTGQFEAWNYDDSANYVLYANRAGTVFNTQYDGLQRPVSVANTGGAPAVLYSYDNLSQVTGLSDGVSFLYTYTYDALGGQTSESGPLGTLSSSYDVAGHRHRLTWPDGAYADYGHYATGELGGINLTIGSSTVPVWGQVYDNLGRPVATYRGTGGATTAYGYDPISRPTSMTHNPANTSEDVTYAYQHNPAGQIFVRSVSNSGYLYTPPSAYTPSTSDAMNRVTSVGGTGIGYDGNSNLTTGLGQTYGYDAKNQLTTAGSTASFVYDPAGRLYQEVNSATPSYTRFLYDGAQLVAEYDGLGGIIRRHVPGAGLDATVATFAGSGIGSPSWLLGDERQSVVALTDGSGNATQINRYDEYGVPQSGNGGRFGYTGQMYLPDAGLYHYRARAYAPQIGRFLQTDPIGYGAGMNLYAYVVGDPINFTDPWGLQSSRRLPIDPVTASRCPPGATCISGADNIRDFLDFQDANTRFDDIPVTGRRVGGAATLADGSPHPLGITRRQQCKLEAAADYLSDGSELLQNAAAVTLAGTIYGAWSTAAYPPASGAVLAGGATASGFFMASSAGAGGLSALLRFASNGNSLPLFFEFAGGRAGDTLGPIVGRFLGILDKSLSGVRNYRACG